MFINGKTAHHGKKAVDESAEQHVLASALSLLREIALTQVLT